MSHDGKTELRVEVPVDDIRVLDGYIRRSDVLFKRSFGNGSLAPGWVGV